METFNMSTGERRAKDMPTIAHTPNRMGKPQLLSDHLRNVSQRMSVMLEPINLSNMGELIGLLHDIGKAAPEWQAYISNPERSKNHPGHSQYGRIAYNTEVFPFIEMTDVEKDFRYALAQVVYSHHSALHDDVDFDEPDFSIERSWQQDSANNFAGDICILRVAVDGVIDDEALQQLFARAYAEYESAWMDIQERNERQYADQELRSNAIRFELNLLNALLLSVLMDADWYDTQNHEDGIYSPVLPETPAWADIIRPFEDSMSGFKADTEMNRIRQEVSEACLAAATCDPEHGAYKLSVFCGGGKTLASTRYAIHHAEKHSKRHVFYIIPFTSIIEQNAAVLRDACTADDAILLEHHCNAGLDLNADVRELLEEEDGGSYVRKTVARYDEPLVLTTQVRFLMTLFSKDKRNRRLFADYINSEVIFDEFQAMPVKLMDMFYIAVEFMIHIMHCNVVLCSATQAVSSNYGLSDVSYLTGTDWNAKYADKLGRADFIDLSAYSNPSAPVMTLGQIGDLVEDELVERDSCLVIVNSRNQARELFQNLSERLDNGVLIFHLSTNMYPRHRTAVLSDMIDVLARHEQKIVCVSTSLIEAGVDVSFDTVVRYLNGFDSIVQCGGRCNRHGEQTRGHVYIVNEPRAIPMYRDQQNATGAVICEYGKDLTNRLTDGLATYYDEYIAPLKEQGETKFPYKVIGEADYMTSLVDLWGDNIEYVDNHPSQSWRTPHGELPCHHSLVRTAQKAFSVIEDNNNNEIVVCDVQRCSELLEAYEQATSFKQLRQVQQQLQQYTVSLTFGDFKQVYDFLETKSNVMLGTSISVLPDGNCYDDKCGVLPADDDDFIF